MKINSFTPTGRTVKTLALFLAVILGLTLFTACGSAESADKKAKSKKSKKADLEEEEEEAEVSEKKDKESKDSKDGAHKNDKKEGQDEKAEKVNVDAIWEDLMKGNKRFMSGKHTTVDYKAARIALSKGQKPQVIVLGCADSRVPPEFVFDKNLGELFVVREAGNIADEVSLGSIEYAIEHLHAKLIVVLGHESCGAVAAAVSGEKMPTKNLTEIVDTIAPAFEGSKTCIIGAPANMACVEENTQHSAGDLLLKSPVIKEALEKGHIGIVSAVYRFDTGEVKRLK